MEVKVHFCEPVVVGTEREVVVMKIHRLVAVARMVTEEERKLEDTAIHVSVAATMVVVIVHCAVSVVALSVGVLVAGCEHGELVMVEAVL